MFKDTNELIYKTETNSQISKSSLQPPKWNRGEMINQEIGINIYMASLVAQTVKCLPVMRETVQSLGWEDPLEKEMATHPSSLAWKIPWTEQPGGLWPWDLKELDTTERLHSLTSLTDSLLTHTLYTLLYKKS